MRRIILYKGDSEAPADLAIGERVGLVRGDGPREGASMGYATITRNDQHGLAFDVEDSDVRTHSPVMTGTTPS